MRETDESTKPDFWNQRYARGDTPWAAGVVSAALNAFLSRTQNPGRVLIPGCGADYQTITAFDAAGFDVTAVDFSPVAVDKVTDLLGPGPGPKIILADFFSLAFERTFDLIYERTFLCALPPARWREYAGRVAELLLPGGLLAGVFFYGLETEPPPYPITEVEAEQLFGRSFQLRQNEPVTDSVEMFAGMERWQEWERR